MDNINLKTKMPDVKPLVSHYMDQLFLNQLFKKYIPKTSTSAGHNTDYRPDCLQLVFGLNITDDGHGEQGSHLDF